jgi:hypothetical protein
MIVCSIINRCARARAREVDGGRGAGRGGEGEIRVSPRVCCTPATLCGNKNGTLRQTLPSYPTPPLRDCSAHPSSPALPPSRLTSSFLARCAVMHARDKVQRSPVSIPTAESDGVVGREVGRRVGSVARPAGNFALDPLSKHAKYHRRLCPAAPPAIGRRKLTCERPGNIARIKKPSALALDRRWEGRK